MDSRICQTSTASPAEPGGLSCWASETAALIEAVEAFREAEYGSLETARQHSHAAFNRAGGRDVRA